MSGLPLTGITPEPISGYLKGLGVLRLVAEQVDHEARGLWHNGIFQLQTKLGKEDLLGFFLHHYAPTPILNPWSKGSGFHPKDNTKALSALLGSANPRMAAYRRMIPLLTDLFSKVRSGNVGLKDQELKQVLLLEIRRTMPDEFLVWLDAVVVLLDDGQAYPPMFGTGGNDGRLDFSQNFMGRLAALGLHNEIPETKARGLLEQSLFGTPVQGLGKDAVGQFNPGRAGGPNSTQGMEGDAGDNPWDFLLQFEGGVLFSAGATRKLNHARSNKAHMPFTVDASGIDASMARTESTSARGEIWLPLWHRPSSLREIRSLLSEGRAEVGRQRAASGLDLARAISGLGVDRGVSAFSRMGILNRNGKAFLVTPLGQYPVRYQPLVDLLRELDPWHQSFTYAAKAKGAPARYGALLSQLELALLAFARQSESRRLTDVLVALGRCFHGMANNLNFCQGVHKGLLPALGTGWLSGADDGSPEFRLARAFASINDSQPALPGKSGIGPLACNLLPVSPQGERLAWQKTASPACVMGTTNLAMLLGKALQRRLVDAIRLGRDKLPLVSGRPQRFSMNPACPASTGDIALFLAGETDDERLFLLLHGMLAVRVDRVPVEPSSGANSPRAFCLLKPHFVPETVRVQGVDIPSSAKPEWISLMLADRPGEATALAARRLRNLGLSPTPHRRGRFAEEEFRLDPGVPGEKLAASLLLPLGQGTIRRLTESVLRISEDQTA